MDVLILEAAAAGATAVAAIAMRYRTPANKKSALPPISLMTRPIRELRRRHRRIARDIIELAHECLERHPAGSFEAFTAAETMRNYLPETLAAYIAVPRALRRTSRAARPSADDELSRQLRMLQNGLERIREAAAEVGATRMIANGVFLSERFARSEFPAQALHQRSLFREVVDVLRRNKPHLFE